MAQEVFANAAGSYSAELTRRAMYSWAARTAANSPGVIAGGLEAAGDLALTAPGSGMTCNVAAGACLVGGTSGGAQGGYYFRNTASYSAAISAANATNPRVDAIVVTIADGGYTQPSDVGGTVNGGVIAVLTGTPTAGATLTNLSGVASIPLSSLLLGYVLVPAASSNVTSGNISNVAALVSLQPKSLLYRYQQTVSNYSTTATSLALVDGTNMNPSLALGGTIRVTLSTSFSVSGSPYQGVFDLMVDGSLQNDRMYVQSPAANAESRSLQWTIQPTAGVHTVGVAYANNQAGTMTLYGAAAGFERCTFTVERIG